MTVLVAIPYWRTAEPYIEEAVASVLAQTHSDLVCLVAGDGEEPPVRASDSRLVVVGFPTNEGTPATQQAMLLASPFAWYAPMGADDWIEPDYLERLLALETKANACGALFHFDGQREWPVTDSIGNPAHDEFGLYDAELLRSLGGYGAERRCGQDTLLYLQLLPHLVPVSRTWQPRYHKRIHGASLTHDPATTFGTPYRNEVFAHNDEVAAMCARWGFDDLAKVRAFREFLLGPRLREVLAERVAIVAAALEPLAVAA